MSFAVRVALLLFAVAWGANHFVPLLPVYRVVLGLSPSEVAQIFGVYAVGLVPGLLIGGPQSDRWGRARLVLPAALVALGGSAILGATMPRYDWLLLGRFVVGLGSGVVFSAATAWVQDLASTNAGGGTGARRAAIALSLGFGGGPLIAGVLAQWAPSPLRLPYAVQGLVLIGAWVLVASDRSNGRGDNATSRAMMGRSDDRGGRGFPKGFISEIVPATPWVFALPSISFAVLPAAMETRLAGYGAVFAGVVAAVTLLAGVLAQAPLRAHSPQRAARIGVACGLGGLLCAALAVSYESAVGVVASAGILGAGYGGCLVSGLRFVELNSPPGVRGAHTGAFYVLAYSGFAAPLLLAQVSRRVGNASAVLMAAGVAGISLLLLLRSRVADP